MKGGGKPRSHCNSGGGKKKAGTVSLPSHLLLRPRLGKHSDGALHCTEEFFGGARDPPPQTPRIDVFMVARVVLYNSVREKSRWKKTGIVENSTETRATSMLLWQGAAKSPWLSPKPAREKMFCYQVVSISPRPAHPHLIAVSLFQKLLQQFNAAAATPLCSFLASIPVRSYFAIRQHFTKKCVNLTLPPRRKKLTFRGVQ